MQFVLVIYFSENQFNFDFLIKKRIIIIYLYIFRKLVENISMN